MISTVRISVAKGAKIIAMGTRIASKGCSVIGAGARVLDSAISVR